MPPGRKTISRHHGDPCTTIGKAAMMGSGNDHNGSRWLDESLSVPFFLDDSTGKVLVNPQVRILMCIATLKMNTVSYFGKGSSFPKISGNCGPPRAAFRRTNRLEERIIKPGYPSLSTAPRREFWPDVLDTDAARTSTRISFGSGFGRSLNFNLISETRI